MLVQRTLYHISQFYKQLPATFTRGEAVSFGKRIFLQPRTSDKYLSILIAHSKLARDSGVYRKV
jgi:hypothetical protein